VFVKNSNAVIGSGSLKSQNTMRKRQKAYKKLIKMSHERFLDPNNVTVSETMPKSILSDHGIDTIKRKKLVYSGGKCK
jgi:hypothetical protein